MEEKRIRKCYICGRDISMQGLRTKTCSTKIYGESANECKRKWRQVYQFIVKHKKNESRRLNELLKEMHQQLLETLKLNI